MKHAQSKAGFSLVEMALVLLGIGILLGAVITGQSLLHTSRLNKITSEYQNYQASVLAFSDKYRTLPGDMKNATSYWPGLNATAACTTPRITWSGSTPVATNPGDSILTVTTGQTCNGSGDAIIGYYSSGSSLLAHESFRFWQHLSLAGLINGSFTGNSGNAAQVRAHSGGTNAPSAALSGSLWAALFIESADGSATTTNPYFNRTYGNVLLFGSNQTNNYPFAPALTQQEAMSIDRKLDDGLPDKGIISAVLTNSGTQSECTTAVGNSTLTGASNNPSYDASKDSIACALYFLLPQAVRGPRSVRVYQPE